ncbi:uncharacterized protein LOC120092050 [Benincasa hispida]|uniref:uncharacterized protein LOC120092050 n=1 Tax=Benincasa hispida TaxID=102211 RepID=UPI001901AFBE|nr:uncharacterized protein LOC120092050 [Benincasa hispida]
MKALATSKSIIANSTPSSYFAPSLKERLLSGGPEFISYRRPWKLANFGLEHLVPSRRGGIDLISCFSSPHQADTQNDAVENQETNQSKTVRVKFQLQKECTFGEHFFVVGDDPIFGSWDVSSAIPLNWADGHQWAAEVEIPVGKTIQFKFILQGTTGNVVWQPGPDRTFEPWETSNTIIVSEDWDSAESRIRSEEKIVNQEEDSSIAQEKLVIKENLTYPNEELIPNTNKDSIAEKPSVESIDGSNISASEENGSNISASEENASNVSLSEDNPSSISGSKENARVLVAENISSPKESFILNTSNKAVSEVHSNSNGETTITSESDTKITEEILENDEKDDGVNYGVQESFVNKGVPILVPGLPPTPTTSNQYAPPNEVKDDGSIDGINDTNDRTLPENIQKNQKPDPDVMAGQEMEVKSSYEEIRQEDDTNIIENRSDLQEINKDIVQNDITWGHKTLKKFLSSLRLL